MNGMKRSKISVCLKVFKETDALLRFAVWGIGGAAEVLALKHQVFERKRMRGKRNLYGIIWNKKQTWRKQVDKKSHLSKIWYRLGLWPFGHGPLFTPFGAKEGKRT